MRSDNKLEICKNTRKTVSEALFKTLNRLISRKNVSEVDFRDEWLGQIRKDPQIFKDGWYIPPSHGMAVLFATDKDPERVSIKSLRSKEYLPRNDILRRLTE